MTVSNTPGSLTQEIPVLSWLLDNRWEEAVFSSLKNELQGFPGGTVVKNPPANAGDTGSSPGPGRFHMPRSN